MSAPLSGRRGGSSFARSWDAFSYKRLADVDLTSASSLGALLTLVAYFVTASLLAFETLAFLSVVVRQETVMVK